MTRAFGYSTGTMVFADNWAADTPYYTNYQARNGEIYLCIADHVSSADTAPGAGASWESCWIKQVWQMDLTYGRGNSSVQTMALVGLGELVDQNAVGILLRNFCYVTYKPHFDVVAGFGKIVNPMFSVLSDYTISPVDMHLLGDIDEVTMWTKRYSISRVRNYAYSTSSPYAWTTVQTLIGCVELQHPTLILLYQNKINRFINLIGHSYKR